MKLYFVFACVVTVVLLAVVACVGPTPTPPPSVLPSPTASPLLLPELSQNESVVRVSPEEDNQMSLVELLSTLAAGGLLGGIIAFLAERFEWFQGLSSKAKFWLIGGISIGIPLIAQALLLNVPAEFWQSLEPYWRAALAGGTVWLGSQLVHKYLK